MFLMIIAIMINHFYYIFQCHHEKYLHLSKFCCKIFFRLFGFRFKAAKAEFRLSSQLLIANVSSLGNTESVLIHTCKFFKFFKLLWCYSEYFAATCRYPTGPRSRVPFYGLPLSLCCSFPCWQPRPSSS